MKKLIYLFLTVLIVACNNSKSKQQSDCNVIYLGSNGVTIKACEDANIDDTGVINGVTYTVVNRTRLRKMIANKEDVTKVVTTRVTDMSKLFNNDINFNQPIGNWDVSNVTDMSYMFNDAFSFNQPIGNWDVSNVINMSAMFHQTNFYQDIGDWDVSSVTDMAGMFAMSSFYQYIGNWDVSSVKNMNAMFFDTYFNQDLSYWDVSSVKDCMDFGLRTRQWTLPKPDFTNCYP